jgi:hypothetical protein
MLNVLSFDTRADLRIRYMSTEWKCLNYSNPLSSRNAPDPASHLFSLVLHLEQHDRQGQGRCVQDSEPYLALSHGGIDRSAKAAQSFDAERLWRTHQTAESRLAVRRRGCRAPGRTESAKP